MRFVIILPAAALFSFLTAIAPQRETDPVDVQPAARTSAVASGESVATQTWRVVVLAKNGPVRIAIECRLPRGEATLAEQPFRDSIARLFRYLDKDGNGSLDAAEAARTPPGPHPAASTTTGGQPITVYVAFNPRVLDVDADGNVTLDELVEYYQAGINFVAPQAVPTAASEQSRRLGLVLLSRIDADKNGRLSKDEVAAAADALLQFDRDNNEVVTVDEISPAGAPPQNAFGLVPMNPGPPLLGDPPSLIVLAEKDEFPQVVRQMLQTYGDKSYGPRRIRTLTRKEISLPADLFSRLDRNRDQLLDAVELAGYLTLPPDVRIRVDVGVGPQRVSAIEVRPAEERRRQPVRSARINSAALAANVGGAEVVLQLENRPLPSLEQIREHFLKLLAETDSDGDGVIVLQEAAASRLRSHFLRMDADSDLRLTKRELLEYVAEVRYPMMAGSARLLLTAAAEGDGLFDLLDFNRDGQLGLRELLSVEAALQRADQNTDGFVDPTEIPQSYRLLLTRSVAGLFDAPLLGERESNEPPWFQRMDKNGDGDVSRREFLGSGEQFRQFDADRDGLIDIEEASTVGRELAPGRG